MKHQETRVSYSPERGFFRPYPINEDIFRQGGLRIFDTAESVHHLLVLKMARQLLQATSWGEKATHSWDKARVRPFCFSAYDTLYKIKSVFSAIWGDPCHKSGATHSQIQPPGLCNLALWKGGADILLWRQKLLGLKTK